MNMNKLILCAILLVSAVSFCVMISPVCVYTKECSALRPASQGVSDEQEIAGALQMSGTPSAEGEQGVNIPGPDASARQWRQAIEQASSIAVLTKLENRLGAAKLQPHIIESLRKAIEVRKGELSGDKARLATEPIAAAGKASTSAAETSGKPNSSTLEVEWLQIVRFISSVNTLEKLAEFENRLKAHAAMKQHPELLEQGTQLIADRKKVLEAAGRASAPAVETLDEPHPKIVEDEWSQIVRFIGSRNTLKELADFEKSLRTHDAMRKHPDLLQQGTHLIADRKKALEEAARKESEALDEAIRTIKKAYVLLGEGLTEFSKASAHLKQALDSKDIRTIKTHLTRFLEVRTRLVGLLNQYTEKWGELWLSNMLVSPGTNVNESRSDSDASERQISNIASINGIRHEPSYYWMQLKKTDAQLIKLCAKYQVPHNIPPPDLEDITFDLSGQIKLQVIAAIDSQA